MKQVKTDLSTPEKALQSFLDALIRRDSKNMFACIEGVASITPFPMKSKPSLNHSLQLHILSKKKIDSSGVMLTVQVVLKQPDYPVEKSAKETIILHLKNHKWYIAARETIEISSDRKNILDGRSKPVKTLFAPIIFRLLYGNVLHNARQSFYSDINNSHVKQNFKKILIACLMFVQDNNKIFKCTSENYITCIRSYIARIEPEYVMKDFFTSPIDEPKTISYKFNPKLSGVSLSKISVPEKTVVLFEGEYAKPLFRYANKALIGFVDGNVKLVTPEEAKQLRWTP
jgi:hypothetical protein